MPSTAFDGRDLWSGSWRGDGRHKRVLVGQGEQYAKCAWCERRRDWSRELDVDHYRPKARVTRWRESPSDGVATPPREESIGAGYWWLAFSWSNYALACKTCNQDWKRNLFPVQEPRPPCTEGVEHHERPLLLDPMTPFRSRDHFQWDKVGYISGVSEIGRATIITCGLNRRELVALRGRIAGTVRTELRRLNEHRQRRDLAGVKAALVNLRNLGDDSSEFAGMARWFIETQLHWSWIDFSARVDQSGLTRS